ncbi:Indoleamine 2,3-dioxygenase [Rhodocollybia butyracea]|uniref:Indoleamine 2,3-dioxygenase n=1 Tax=Rhodocollybia butyracea TaxID=206335 RepID=A0A9P5UCC3_9AGAR|nr:Indoleamine 2,3-dioxygenase [Rhodocollybia butyracea]
MPDYFAFIAYFVNIFTQRFRASKHVLPSQTDFDIDPVTGFLPSEPLPRLSCQYKIWEDALAEAPEILRLGDDLSEEALALKTEGESWRARMKLIPVLDIQPLTDQRLLQRAHVVLTWLVQYYVHSLPPALPPAPKIIPKSIAVPLVEVSRTLGIAPIITYADTVTWNWELIHPEKPVTIDNMAIVHSFSGREDEQHFYQVQATIELHGAQLLRMIEGYNQIPILDDSVSIIRLATDLDSLTQMIEEISNLIQSVREGCDPHVFYWYMRPWYNGSSAKGPSDSGWIYEGVDSTVPELQYLSGPSGGQSAVIHALDLFLGISHDKLEDQDLKSCAKNGKSHQGFMERMRMYMLGKHREYLQHLEKSPCFVRDVAQRAPVLQGPYNNAIAALKKLRSLHMRIAISYIVDMSKTTCPLVVNPLVSGIDQGTEQVRGTGGNKVAVLLKAGIDATSKVALRSQV